MCFAVSLFVLVNIKVLDLPFNSSALVYFKVTIIMKISLPIIQNAKCPANFFKNYFGIFCPALVVTVGVTSHTDHLCLFVDVNNLIHCILLVL